MFTSVKEKLQKKMKHKNVCMSLRNREYSEKNKMVWGETTRIHGLDAHFGVLQWTELLVTGFTNVYFRERKTAKKNETQKRLHVFEK